MRWLRRLLFGKPDWTPAEYAAEVVAIRRYVQRIADLVIEARGRR